MKAQAAILEALGAWLEQVGEETGKKGNQMPITYSGARDQREVAVKNLVATVLHKSRADITDTVTWERLVSCTNCVSLRRGADTTSTSIIMISTPSTAHARALRFCSCSSGLSIDVLHLWFLQPWLLLNATCLSPHVRCAEVKLADPQDAGRFRTSIPGGGGVRGRQDAPHAHTACT